MPTSRFSFSLAFEIIFIYQSFTFSAIIPAIKYFGSTDNYNTKTTERLHIDFAKDAYRTSNRKDEYAQMTRWVERRKKIAYHTNYIAWTLEALANSSQVSIPLHPLSLILIFLELSVLMRSSFSPRVTRFLTAKAVSLLKLEDPSFRGYGAVGFTQALRRLTNMHNSSSCHFGMFLSGIKSYSRIRTYLRARPLIPSLLTHEGTNYNSEDQVTRVSHFDMTLISVKEASDSPVQGSEGFGQSSHCLIKTWIPYIHQQIQKMLLPADLRSTSCSSSGAPSLHVTQKLIPASTVPDDKLHQTERLLPPLYLWTDHYPKWGGAVPSLGMEMGDSA
ncbi:hypothetical protein AAF712_005684 [Marasmius tenuissimus]|uniref:Uncharacterized protein n=1 Tax=Marasmius tenuissimus TaxID=585030 RepID=A0ABR3A0A6_9AGAR